MALIQGEKQGRSMLRHAYFLVVLGFWTGVAFADFQRPSSFAELISVEATRSMVLETGAFEVSLGARGSLVFLRQTDGRYRIVGRLPESESLPVCAAVQYSRSGETFGFGVCHIQDWEPPAGFEEEIVRGYSFGDFLDLMSRTGTELPATAGDFEEELPSYIAATTYNGAPEINLELWATRAAVMLTCREPDGRSTSGFESVDLGIETSRGECREAKRDHSQQRVLAAHDQSAIVQDGLASALADSQEALADLAAAQADRDAAQLDLDRMNARIERLRQELEFARRLNSSLSE